MTFGGIACNCSDPPRRKKSEQTNASELALEESSKTGSLITVGASREPIQKAIHKVGL